TSTCIPIHYISTTSVLSNDINETQSIDLNSPNQLRSGYAQSKWVAEKLIAKASQFGLPIITYRLGLILANTETGACNRNDFYTLLIAAIMKVKCYPTEVTTVVITGTPAPIAARTIIDLSEQKTDAYGNIYEIVDQEKICIFGTI
ncbi:MAG: SDR family oxidoreductase, partial [Nostoc sp.]